ncbi:MAG: tyrosine-type recombinase/integrase [Acutalibacteraceae bacterium]
MGMNYTMEIRRFEQHMIAEEKSAATIEKYLRDIRSFFAYLSDRQLCKEEMVAYKAYLTGQYAPASVNSMLIAMNRFLRFLGLQDCCVRPLKIQRQIFCPEEKELTQAEYQRLVRSAGDSQLSFVLQTICGTGIRISELQYITLEAVRAGKAVVNCKNKTRVIFIPAPLQKILKQYIKKTGITAGSVFVSQNGKPLDRSSVWRQMKRLCKKANVPPEKVYPHNLRHLFARIFYGIKKDIVRLADILGHSSINTTRIYTLETGTRHLNDLIQVQRHILLT